MHRDALRILNLRDLLNEFGTMAEIARRADTEPNYLYQVINQYKTKAGNPRSLGNDLADKIEDGCNKHRGWLDCDHRTTTTSQLSSDEAALIALYRKASTDLKNSIRHLADLADNA